MAVSDGFVILLASFSLVSGTVTNVALMKVAWMSSTFDQNHAANKAVDGDTTADGVNHVAHTATGHNTAWWKVDLVTPVQSARVTLYFRTDYKGRRNGVQLYTSATNSSNPKEGNLCRTVTGRPDGTDIPDVLDVTCPGTWRYLTVYTDTDNTHGVILDFAEVQVWTCTSGTYGANCAKDCSSRHCKTSSSTCDRFNGTCPDRCKDGWMGVDCITVCASGTYGANCAENCTFRHCKMSSTACDHISGACPDGGCVDGWMGIDCTTECASGYYGANCGKSCSLRNCKEDSNCDRIQGLCKGGCAAGYNGTDCTEALVNCPDGRYGPGCTEFCNSRNCKTLSPVCDVIGSCTDGCREGWQNADCRIPCPSGTYGSNCSKSCDSRQCETARTACDHVSGTCTTGCQEGWIGEDCTQRCKPGTYGPDCSRCGYCDVTCNAADGRCPGECLDGFTGDRCDVDVRDSVAKIGLIEGAVGMAIGMVVMLLVGVGLFMCLLKHGRLKWIPSNGADPKGGRKKGYTDETPGLENPDYTELNDVTREREEKSAYDVVQS